MLTDKKTTAKQISDVTKPDKTPPQKNSRPVIVTNRPVIQDPMVIADNVDDDSTLSAPALPKKSRMVIKPLDAGILEPIAGPTDDQKPLAVTEVQAVADNKPELDTAEPAPAEPTNKSESENSEHEALSKQSNNYFDEPAVEQSTSSDEEAAIAAEAKRHEEIEKLAESKQYYLSINAVEKRRTKRFVMAGILLVIILAVAWLDIALDAGLITIDHLKPVTHFFSN